MESQGKEKRKRSLRDRAAKIGLGIAIGAGVGAALGNMGVGMAIGIALSGVWEFASARMGRADASDCS
ncbi:MAG: glycine zipper family protein [Chloroflexi bacterium]|nr:glycine zipper family protein [Chloroflexota bacterium]